MARVALVSHDVQTVLGGKAGGVGAFVTHFARLLRAQGEDVTILLTRQEEFPVAVDPEWRERYKRWGVGLLEFHNAPPSRERWSDAWPLRLSEQILPHLENFDIAYFQDWANVAFQAVRHKRFGPAKLPLIVTVFHGPSVWERTGNQRYPRIPDDLHVEFMERYSARHSDAVVAPSRYMLDWTLKQGWQFDCEPQVLGLPFVADDADTGSNAGPAGKLKRLVFFGRMEKRKGLSLFTQAVQRIPDLWPDIEEIIFLGEEKERGSVEAVRNDLADSRLKLTHIGNLDSAGARRFLASVVHDSLVVIPSPAENFPYTVIEASRIPGIEMTCSNGGGVPEVLDFSKTDRLFDPYPAALASKIRQRFGAPPRPSALPAYDAEKANARWLEFHRETLRPRNPRQLPALSAQLPVDICITYFNKGPYLPQLLQALEAQTVQGFGVIAVDDGSTEPESIAIFDEMSERYRDRGWIFFRQSNEFVDAARNRAAARSKAEYLLFIDADDIPAPHTVERLLQAALYSQDDCVLSGGFLLKDNDPDRATGARYLPLGPNLVSGLVDPIVFGLPMIFIRRRVFEALGGYREMRGVGHEDWELQVRLLLAGYRTDVFPECLLYFRRLSEGLAAISSDFLAKQRLTGAYESRLAEAGMQGLASLVHALNRRCLELEAETPRNIRLENRVRQMLEKAGHRTP